MVLIPLDEAFIYKRNYSKLNFLLAERKKDEQTIDSCSNLLGGYVERYIFGGRPAQSFRVERMHVS